MNATALKTAGKYLGVSSVLIFFVVLLTLVFSFLGTIICAALAGMMMGATKPSRWVSIPTAMVFPAVIFSVLYVTKAQLQPRQLIVVSFLCFGVFWLIYYLASLLMFIEQKQQPSAASALAPSLAQTPPAAAEQPANPDPAAAPPQLVELKLEQLQGRWLLELPGADGRPEKKVIEINSGNLVFSAPDPGGRLLACARAGVKLESLGSSTGLVVSASRKPPAG